MTNEEFQVTKLKDLQRLTGISVPKWSKYFNGVISPTETTIRRCAASLFMRPEEFLKAFDMRRTRTLEEKRVRGEKKNTPLSKSVKRA